MTPIAGLKEPAEAVAFATGGVSAPTDHGSRGGVPIVTPGNRADVAGAASETVTSGADGGSFVTCVRAGSGGAVAVEAVAGIGFFSASFNCASSRRIRAS